jgi:hypothetical protein
MDEAAIVDDRFILSSARQCMVPGLHSNTKSLIAVTTVEGAAFLPDTCGGQPVQRISKIVRHGCGEAVRYQRLLRERYGH